MSLPASPLRTLRVVALVALSLAAAAVNAAANEPIAQAITAQPSVAAGAQSSPATGARPSPAAVAQPSPAAVAQPSPAAVAQPSPAAGAQPGPAAGAAARTPRKHDGAAKRVNGVVVPKSAGTPQDARHASGAEPKRKRAAATRARATASKSKPAAQGSKSKAQRRKPGHGAHPGRAPVRKTRGGAATAAAAAASIPTTYAQREDVQQFIAELCASDGFARSELTGLFAQVSHQASVVAAMTRPVLAPPKWFEYAPRFVSDARVEGGVRFWEAHGEALARAEAEYGVPAEVIVAIIGVETFYGRNTGGYRVLDALSTLAFDYPRRAEYFRGELKQFLLFAREQGLSPLAPRGSYAGAMGLPQFMPGSFRAYAVDYDHDGRIDLWSDPEDAIGSVANYLARHDWRRGARVMEPALFDAADRDAIARSLDGGLSERRPLEAWERAGVVSSVPRGRGDAAPGESVGLLLLEEADAPAYWLVFDNWYVITRYNKSRLYASAVWQLAQAVKAQRLASLPR